MQIANGYSKKNSDYKSVILKAMVKTGVRIAWCSLYSSRGSTFDEAAVCPVFIFSVIMLRTRWRFLYDRNHLECQLYSSVF
jgi:hypothetical protein